MAASNDATPREHPLRRALAVLGLIGIVPTAFLLATGELGVADAAMRASATMAIVVVLDRVAAWTWRQAVVASYRRRIEAEMDAATD